MKRILFYSDFHCVNMNVTQSQIQIVRLQIAGETEVTHSTSLPEPLVPKRYPKGLRVT